MEAPPTMTQRIAAEILAPVREGMDRDGDAALVGRDVYASLPVLGAVRRFIDDERRRTRRMVLSLVLLFAIVMVALVSALVFFTETRMRKIQAVIEKEQQTITAAALEMSAIRQDISGQAERISKQFDDGGKKAASALAFVEAFGASMTGAVADLQFLRQNIGGVVGLRIQDAGVVKELGDGRNPLINNRLDELSRENTLLRGRLDGTVGRQAEPSWSPWPVPVGGDNGITLRLASSNFGSSIRWRLPEP